MVIRFNFFYYFKPVHSSIILFYKHSKTDLVLNLIKIKKSIIFFIEVFYIELSLNIGCTRSLIETCWVKFLFYFLLNYGKAQQHKVFYQSIKTIENISQLLCLLEVFLKKQEMINNTPFSRYKDSFFIYRNPIN
jgi:hypothetical protein